MNEQLIVKNFGPIKDATVDFKRVTVFIGPTGGGKSTLAKLAAVFRERMLFRTLDFAGRRKIFSDYSLENFFQSKSHFEWIDTGRRYVVKHDLSLPNDIITEASDENLSAANNFNLKLENGTNEISVELTDEMVEKLFAQLQLLEKSKTDKSLKWIPTKSVYNEQLDVIYCISNRSFIPAIEYSWAGLLRDDIGLPKDTLEFANDFSLSRRSVPELDIPFLNAKYIHRNGQDFIKIPESETLFRLYETASGIQSVTPLLVLLEHLSRNTEQAQSFIIEEPELNLFPLAQFELVKILVEKCAQTEGKNDLVLTTHSPYVLTALNLLCYAYRIAQQDEATARKVAKLIPRHCWIDPDQFAAYYVDRPDTKRKQQVRSIINKKTGLIEENELDTASDELGAIFDKLVRLRKPTPTPSRAK